jgi:hypothetical protein
MRRFALLLATLLVSTPLLGAVFGSKKSSELAWDLVGQPGVVTLVNLHPDPKRHRLYSVDYLQEGFIPVCTPVEIVSLTAKEMTFRVPKTGVQYEYLFHKTMQGTPQAHLARIFGKSCPSARIRRMSKVDRQGIEQGSVLPGMTKDAVVIAIGYPPEHATPSLSVDQWRYWRNRFNTIVVVFQKGRVAQIQD